MKKSIEKFNWQDLVKVALAVMAFGIGWFADNQNTSIAYAAMLIVWLLGVVAKYSPKMKWLQGKGPLTLLVFAVSFLLSYLFKPFTLDVFPAWTGDAGTYIPLLSAWIISAISIADKAVVYAMSIYNILLARVLEKVPSTVSRLLKLN